LLIGTVKFPDDLEDSTTYQNERPWHSFTPPEQAILRKTARRFADESRRAGFLRDEVRDVDGEAR